MATSNYSLEFIGRYDQLLADGKRNNRALWIAQEEFKNKIYKIDLAALCYTFIDNTGCCMDSDGWDLYHP